MTEEELKQSLTEYLAAREVANADEAAKELKGKVVGGTRGNAVLEYVSGAPVKEQVIERAPDVFDYDELSRYGYSNLVAPIMDLEGGRRAVYDLMDMESPPLLGPPPKKKVPKLKIDRTGEDDQARYTGLKMGQVLDDDVMGEALARANKKAKEGKDLRPVLMEEKYVQPFADKRNTGPAQTPDWTPEKLDEYAIQQGRAQDWARRSRKGEFVKDPSEISDLSVAVRLYAVSTAFFVSFAFGRATPKFLSEILHVGTKSSAQGLQEVLQFPASALALASLGSCILCAAVLAPERNRGVISWGLKGLFGGPLTILELRQLESLITREEEEAKTAGAQFQQMNDE
eukprot:CAMPEP_0197177462 /NCGR_PEP_ID=MMETSP1423-20130617/3056_1 /TAXON_ID=476441 /ORGANISM="Pseudo-nitzschia heimii, Strain UNC1101" /LENGTH=342 /DNA_ID=CAMNT_0042627007 /DNA_START=253 /DNA_END=1281 /DNA_ORIENTATION=-